jgi:hypothetical protein
MLAGFVQAGHALTSGAQGLASSHGYRTRECNSDILILMTGGFENGSAVCAGALRMGDGMLEGASSGI